MKISAMPNYSTTNTTSFRGCVVKTEALNKAMERAQISDLHNFNKALEIMNRVKDKLEYSFSELNSKFFIGKKIGGTLQYDRLLEPKLASKIVPPSRHSTEYITIVDRDASGNFIDENGKIITDIIELIACGMRKKGFIPVWYERGGYYEAEVNTRIIPEYTTEKESIQHAFKKFVRLISSDYNVPINNQKFNTREELLADINEKLK